MKITELKCTACNGTLKIDENNPHIAVCEYCHTRYVIEDDGNENVHLSTESPNNWYTPQQPAPRPKNNGWGPYGWKRATALSVVGIALILAMNWKGLVRRYRINKELAAITSEAGREAAGRKEAAAETKEAEAEMPFTGAFAVMAETALGRPARELSEQDLSSFQWIEMKYSMDSIDVGYSFENPSETESASLHWISLPRDTTNEEFKQLSRFSGLKKLNVSGYLSADDIKGLSLESLGCYAKSPSELAAALETPEALKDINFKAGLENLDGLNLFTNLERLTLDGGHLTDIKELVNMKGIKALALENCDDITDFSVLAVMPWLEELSVESEGIRDIGFISSLPELKSFSLADAEVLHVNALEGRSGLTSLTIDDCGELTDLSAIQGLTGLTQLSLEIPYNCPQPDLSGLTGLTSLFIDGAKDMAFLKVMGGLESLSINSCEINNSSVFSGLTALKELTCSHIYGELSDWSFVNQIPGLISLDLSGISTYEDISGLFMLPTLQELYLNGMECEIKFSNIQPNERLKVLEMDGVKLYTNVKVSGGGGIVYVDYDKVTLDENTDFLKNFPGLVSLSLADNMLTQLNFAPVLVNLEALDINENYVTKLRPLEALPKLKEVNCAGNPVENYRVLNDSVLIIK